MTTSTVSYTKNLRTASIHNQSGSKIITDAPIDNNGKGEAFSPTDTVATGLASCMLTMMGIAGDTHNFTFLPAVAEVTKVMAAAPRRISRIIIVMTLPKDTYTPKQIKLLETTALNCPVSKSLHPEIEQDITFIYN